MQFLVRREEKFARAAQQLIQAGGASAHAADDITAVRIGDHIDKTRIVLDMTGNTNFSVYVQDNPKSLVSQ